MISNIIKFYKPPNKTCKEAGAMGCTFPPSARVI